MTYLEMRARPRPRASAGARRLGNFSVVHAERPTASFYRYLYETVGAPWLWYERSALDDDALAALVQHPNVEIDVLYVAGVPAGYAELDRRTAGQVELAYFGLVPEFIGQGLGGAFLEWVVNHVWDANPSRFWVHTCTLDHPRALPGYQKAGFVVYRRETGIIDDSRLATLRGGRESRLE